jgi:hypothetical protein
LIQHLIDTIRAWPWLLLTTVGLGMAVALSWSFLRRAETLHRAAMVVCAILGVWTFTLFGQFHDHGQFGHQNLHAHDFYHYYFGSKYLPEWGYEGMYLATVAALEEVGREEPSKAIRFERIRDLREGSHFLYRDEFMPLAEEAKARFSPERWRALKKDLSFMRDKAMDAGWWKNVLLDAGFNPPPSYAVIGGTVSNHLPFNEHTWKWLGGLDFLLIALGVLAIGYAVGPVPALFTLVILGNAPITTYNWTGGSFLRQIWLFFLMIGMASLARRRWYTAGAALGASTAVVIFPGCFLFGAMVPLFYRYYRTGSRIALTRFAVGAASALLVLIGLSLVFYGAHSWLEWKQRIGAHDVTFFTNHLGIKKIITFTPEACAQNFGAGDTLFPEWNGALLYRLHRAGWADLLLVAVLSIWTIGGNLRARPVEASLIIGSGLLVFWTMPASYYTIYVGVFAAFMLANRNRPLARTRFVVFCVALVAAIIMPHYAGDLIVQSFLLSAGWILAIIILSTLRWLERPALPLPPKQQNILIGSAAATVAVLLLIGVAIRDPLHDADFLPPEIVKHDRVADIVDLGSADSEKAHQLEIPEAMRVPRQMMDTYGYRVKDECGIVRKTGALHYDLAPAPKGGRLIVRTDSFYKGDLLTTINGRSLPAIHLEPRQTLMAYLEIPVPADIDGPLHVQQATTASDVGIFTEWLVTPN